MSGGCPRLAKSRPCLTNRSLLLNAFFFMIESDKLPDRGLNTAQFYRPLHPAKDSRHRSSHIAVITLDREGNQAELKQEHVEQNRLKRFF